MQAVPSVNENAINPMCIRPYLFTVCDAFERVIATATELWNICSICITSHKFSATKTFEFPSQTTHTCFSVLDFELSACNLSNRFYFSLSKYDRSIVSVNKVHSTISCWKIS